MMTEHWIVNTSYHHHNSTPGWHANIIAKNKNDAIIYTER
ncbi:hypothetical protein LCGC14_1801480 [marine sediment metagenome]|uniref:Uncharacterized protein n=1 Tax=marine sediment metagenome TaxID=412755 RepID=A0A0F9JP39_9ZZZZ